MIQLKPFKADDWIYLSAWISNEREFIQFAGKIFTFPLDKNQIEVYLSDPLRTVFKIADENELIIGMAEISIEQENTAKLARILIGEKSMRGKGIGAALMRILIDYAFNTLKKEQIILNVYSWNTAAIKCYANAGFVRTSKPIKYVKVGNEEWESLEMKLHL